MQILKMPNMRKVKSACWDKGNFLKRNEHLSNGKAINCVNGVLLLGSFVCGGVDVV